MSDPWKQLTRYAASHHGVVSSEAMKALGIDNNQMYRFHQAARIRRLAPGTYVVVGTPQTWRQRAMVASLSSHAWASHRTAAALLGLDGFPPDQIEVVSLYGTRRGQRPWKVHCTRRLRSVDLTKVDGIPCTSVPRTVLDLAAVAPPDAVAAALDSACRWSPGMLTCITRRFLELTGSGRRGSKLMRALLEDRHGTGKFTQSGFESITRRLTRSLGLPRPVAQHPIQAGTFNAFLDLAWPEIRWAVECDSLAWHSGKRAHVGDRRRRRRLKLLGWDLVEVTYDDVFKRPGETGKQLFALYAERAATFAAAHPHLASVPTHSVL